MTIQWYKNKYDNKGKEYSLFDFLEEIKNEKYIDIIGKVRQCENREDKDIFKSTLPAVTFAGTFYKRHHTQVKDKSGVMVLDFDFETTDELEAKRQELINDPFIFCVFLSPSGKGLKALINYHIEANHNLVFDALKDRFPALDKSGRDIGRLCYVSADKDIYLDMDKLIWYEEKETSYTPTKSKNYAYFTKHLITPTEQDYIDTTMYIVSELENGKGNGNINYTYPEGNRNNGAFKISKYLLEYGLSEGVILSTLTQKAPGLPEHEYRSAFNSANQNISKTRYWIYRERYLQIVAEHKKNNKNRKKTKEEKELEAQYFEEKKQHLEEKNKELKELVQITVANTPIDNTPDNITQEFQTTILQNDIIKQSVVRSAKIEILPFWYYDLESKNMKLKLNNVLFYKSLSQIGYKKYYQTETKKDAQFGLLQNNIFYEKTIDEIKNELKNLIENSNIEEKDKILELIVKQDSALYSTGTMVYLDELDRKKELKPNTKISYQLFLNCIVCVQKNKVEILDYDKINGFVWNHQIKQRNFILNQDKEFLQKSQIYKFVQNTQKKDGKENSERFNSFCKTIGYLAKGYHSAMERKIVVFTDGNSTNHNLNNGRRGKTVLIRDILSQYTPTTMLSSSHGDITTDRFWLSSYRQGDRIICFNDLDARSVELKQFYNLTDGFDVERKGKDRIILRDLDVPAVVITANHLPKYNPQETSSLARLQVIEFSDYYNINNTPFQEFNCELGKWDENDDQWLLLDNFIIYCLTQYLNNGLDSITPTEAIETALQSQIGEDRIEAFNDLIAERTEITLDFNFEFDFNKLLGYNPEATNSYELSKCIDKRHLETLFAKYASAKGWIETDGIRTSTRRSKRYIKKVKE